MRVSGPIVVDEFTNSKNKWEVLSSDCVSGIVFGFEPDFLYPLENVTVAQGRDATFTCVVNNLGGYRVSGDSSTARVCI